MQIARRDCGEAANPVADGPSLINEDFAMRSKLGARAAFAASAAIGILFFLGPLLFADSPARISVTVSVTDADTGKPINQAHITLQFREPGGKLKRSKTLSYAAKTNAEGRYKFVDIPAGPVLLIVTEEHHQTFGKQFEVSKESPQLEVKLKPPQPVL